jgi:hypothetical protein
MSDSQEPAVLPVFPIVSAALRDVWLQRRVVLRLGAIPFAIALVMHLVLLYLGMDHDRDPGTDLLVNAVSLAPYVLFTVPLLRYLLGEQNVKPSLRWETAHSVFVTWLVVESALFTAVGNLSWPLAYAWAFLMLCLAYASARLSLVLPAVAVGEYPDLKLAWARSRHNGWPLLGIRFVAGALAFVPAFAVAGGMTVLGVDWPNAITRSWLVTAIFAETVDTAALAHCFYRSKSTVRSS